ncbi:hypothetical protein ABEB36_007495 [Hypothenemus hampei]|uniref:Uncharacterized protein n=1 Tax=Hypothenemus hampei TaxID=57062 RepID=A0ABD1EY59_HYPHA
MSVILYGSVFSPPCRTVLITAEAIGVKVELKFVDLAKKEHLTPDFLKINPQHTVPTLDDNGTIIIDSHAIITYLVSKYGKDDSLYPTDIVKRALIDARLHFDSGVTFALLKIVYTSHAYFGQKEYLTPWQNQKILDAYDLVNTFLSQSQWIAGDSITVADISLVTTVISLDAMLAIDKKKYPNIMRWLNAADALPYFDVNRIGKEQYTLAWKKVSQH